MNAMDHGQRAEGVEHCTVAVGVGSTLMVAEGAADAVDGSEIAVAAAGVAAAAANGAPPA